MSERFYIASLKHTNNEHEHITWWAKECRGYTPVVGERIGEYTLAEAAAHNDGVDSIAVPVEAVRTLLSPEPYFRPHAPARWYDQRGPVVDNTRANWDRLIALSIAEGRQRKPRPAPFRGKRRSFAVSEVA